MGLAGLSGGAGELEHAVVASSLRIAVTRTTKFLRDPKALVGVVLIFVFVLTAIFAPLLTHRSPIASNYPPGIPPNVQYLLGTTGLGQDVYSQLIWGTRYSLITGVLAGVGATVLAVVIGMVSGYFGGWVDEILQLITNIFLVIPGLPLMIVLTAYISFGGNLPIIFVIVVTGWAWGARVLRAQTLSLRSMPYVESAKMAGSSSWSIVFKEILPHMYSLIFANLLFAIVFAILSAAGLQFLGLGDLNQMDWGTMLYFADRQGALYSGSWWWYVPPGLAILLFGTALSLLNYAIDEIGNPKLRKKRKKQRFTGTSKEQGL